MSHAALNHSRRAAFGLLAAVVLSACGSGGDDQSAPRPADIADQAADEPDGSDEDAEPTAAGDGGQDGSGQDGSGQDGSGGNDAAQTGGGESFDGVSAGTGLDPERITIDAIGVDAEVIDLGLNDDDTLEVPENFANTGWFEKGARPGEIGPSIIAGHIDSTDGPAVFFELSELEAGAEVEVTSAEGETVTYEVERVEEYSKEAFPTQEVYAFTDEPTMRLITCGGPFDDTIGHYENNIIAYARRVA